MTKDVMLSRVIPIYHITDYRNLEQIIIDGGLICKSKLDANLKKYTDIAQSTIQERRYRKIVEVCKKGYLSDYIPFYFANRTPMLGSIHIGNVKTYTGTQRDIIYLTSSVQNVIDHDLECFFSDCHALVAYSEYYDDLSLLESTIDWEIVTSWHWGDPHNEPIRYEKKQAEFLVHEFFPWNLIEHIITIDQNMKHEVELIISKCINAHKPEVRYRRNYYFDR